MADESTAEPTWKSSGGIDETTSRRDSGRRDGGLMGHALEAPISSAVPSVRATSHASAEASDLERRILAHERILQSLIAHMAETEPKFLLRLSEKFSEPMRMVRNEHDYKDADSYASEFIRAVVRLGERADCIPDPVAPEDRRMETSRATAQGSPELPSATVPHLEVREHAGVWEVLVDGRFYGQYVKQEHAVAAVKMLA